MTDTVETFTFLVINDSSKRFGGDVVNLAGISRRIHVISHLYNHLGRARILPGHFSYCRRTLIRFDTQTSCPPPHPILPAILDCYQAPKESAIEVRNGVVRRI